MSWYAIRTLYHLGTKRNGKYVYEERIVSFCGENFDEAFKKATIESFEYCSCLGNDRQSPYSIKVAYEVDEYTLYDGYELWSNLYESYLNIRQFYKEKYSKYKYIPPRIKNLPNKRMHRTS